MTKIGIGENSFTLGRSVTIEQVIVDYNLGSVDVCFVKYAPSNPNARESSFLHFEGDDASFSNIGGLLVDVINKYKPDQVHIGSAGFGIAVWDYIVKELVASGVYINKNGEVRYCLLSWEIMKLAKEDGHKLYERHLEPMGKKADELLAFSYDNKVLIKLVDENLRGMGKTTALLKLADEKKLAIVSTNRHHYDMLVGMRAKMGLKLLDNILYIPRVGNLDGVTLSYPNFIVDEGTSKDVIKYITGNNLGNLVGGWDRM